MLELWIVNYCSIEGAAMQPGVGASIPSQQHLPYSGCTPPVPATGQSLHVDWEELKGLKYTPGREMLSDLYS